MTTNDGRISTTHIGSLPRPPELLDLLTRRQNGESVDPDEWDETVADAGLTLQIDAPELLTVGHTASYADEPLAAAKDATRLHVEALNEALANGPAEQVRLHTCWGS